MYTNNVNRKFIKTILIGNKEYTSTELYVLIFITLLKLEKFKVKFSYSQHVCVIFNSILNRRIAKPSLPKTKNELRYISLYTHQSISNVYCNIPVSTYPQNGDIVIVAVVIVTPVIKSSCHTVNCSAKIEVCGASSYSETVSIQPIYLGKK